jgi:mannose-6-phosphate isomerase-like protein (cupin superfamily)
MTMEVERPAVAGAPSPVGLGLPDPRFAPGRVHAVEDRLVAVDPIRVRDVQRRLEQGQGGYEIVHESHGLELGVYVLVAPEPDRQQPHDRDEVYVVLSGRGTLRIADDTVSLKEGDAAFVPAGVDHQFTGYEGLSVLVVFAGVERGRGA